MNAIIQVIRSRPVARQLELDGFNLKALSRCAGDGSLRNPILPAFILNMRAVFDTKVF